MNGEETSGDALGQLLETIIDRALVRALEKRNAIFPRVDEETALKIAEINAKPNITIQEAELLYRCSDSYLYRSIRRAENGETNDPIPFFFAGSYVIKHEAFREWLSRQRKERNGEKDCQEREGEITLRDASRAARKGAP